MVMTIYGLKDQFCQIFVRNSQRYFDPTSEHINPPLMVWLRPGFYGTTLQG